MLIFAQCNLSVEEKIKLVKEVGEEIIQEDELKGLFQSNPMPICYDGFANKLINLINFAFINLIKFQIDFI